MLLLCAAGRTPTEIAAVRFCSRSPVSRGVRAYRAGELEWGLEEGAPARRTLLAPALKRSVLAILKVVPRTCGWGRTRWRCAPVALEWHARRAGTGSAETVRQGLPAPGGEWKRAELGAQEDGPQRGPTLARIRYAFEPWQLGMALFFADELDLSLRPKVGSQGRPKGTQGEVLTPGTNAKRYLAGALALATGRTRPCMWERKPRGRFVDLLAKRDRTYPAAPFPSL